jgi:hypothetical protein
MKRLTIAIALGLSLTAQAKIKVAPQNKAKTVPAIYTLGKPMETDLGTATEKAFSGAVVYKCQQVELVAGKSSVGLKPVKEGQ